MTGYTVHTGASKKFVAGWDNVFGEPNKTQSGEKSERKREKKSPEKSGEGGTTPKQKSKAVGKSGNATKGKKK